MKTIILIILTFLSINAFADSGLEFKITPMIGMGGRIQLERTEDYGRDDNLANPRKDVFFITGKAFLFQSDYGGIKMLVGGIGYNYQLNNMSDLSISPFAIKGEEGITLSVDVFRNNEKGGWIGVSIGWGF